MVVRRNVYSSCFWRHTSATRCACWARYPSSRSLIAMGSTSVPYMSNARASGCAIASPLCDAIFSMRILRLLRGPGVRHGGAKTDRQGQRYGSAEHRRRQPGYCVAAGHIAQQSRQKPRLVADRPGSPVAVMVSLPGPRAPRGPSHHLRLVGALLGAIHGAGKSGGLSPGVGHRIDPAGLAPARRTRHRGARLSERAPLLERSAIRTNKFVDRHPAPPFPAAVARPRISRRCDLTTTMPCAPNHEHHYIRTTMLRTHLDARSGTL